MPQQGNDTGFDASTGSPPGSSTSNVTSFSETTGTGCLPRLELGELTLLADAYMGRLQIYDKDHDGRQDVIGGRGIVALAGETFDVYPIPGFPDVDDGRAGMFTSDPTSDLIAFDNGRILVFMDGLRTGAPPIVTEGLEVLDYDIRDLNGDILDDLAVRASGDTLQIWHATGAGTFEFHSVAEAAKGFVAPQLVRFGDDLTSLAAFDFDAKLLAWFERSGGGTFELREELELDPFVWWIGRVPGPEGERLLWTASGGTFLAPQNHVGISWRDQEDWHSRFHEVATALVPPAAADLDADSLVDIVSVTETTLSIACQNDDAPDGFLECATSSLAHAPDRVAILPTQTVPHIVYTTRNDGTWLAPVHALETCK